MARLDGVSNGYARYTPRPTLLILKLSDIANRAASAKLDTSSVYWTTSQALCSLWNNSAISGGPVKTAEAIS